jgi:hypothetical protein
MHDQCKRDKEGGTRPCRARWDAVTGEFLEESGQGEEELDFLSVMQLDVAIGKLPR